MKLIIASFVILSLWFSSFAGGPWTPAKNHTLFILNVSPVIYRTMSDANGKGIVLPRRVIDINTPLYIEYGITNRFSVIGNLNIKSVRTSSSQFTTDDFSVTLPSGRVVGLGNTSVGFKYNLVKKKVLFSLSYFTEFPSVGEKPALGLRTGYNTYSYVPGIHFGQGFDNKLYYLVEAFFAARNKLSHEWRLNAEIGYTLKKKPITLMFKVNVQQPLKNKTVVESPNYRATGLYLNNEAFAAWSVNIAYKINEDWSFISALAGGFQTRLIARTPVISAGVIWNLKPKGS